MLQGFLLLANLAARMYPRISVIGRIPLIDRCAEIIGAINPDCEFNSDHHDSDTGVCWGHEGSRRTEVNVQVDAWTVRVGGTSAYENKRTNCVVALAGAAVAAGELFRAVFAEFLPADRRNRSSYDLQLLDGLSAPMPSNISLGRICLVGAGAIGQAVIYTLAHAPVQGEIVVIDPERISLSNLQRYILATDDDVGASKCKIAARALVGSKLAFQGIEAVWGRSGVEGHAERVCTALDSERARIEVQSSLPKAIYNAWTQPTDLGWSRHESFGQEPCLACLYWPQGERPSQHVLIARALKLDEARILAYLVHNIPVDAALEPGQVPRLPGLPLPTNIESWFQHPLLHDIAKGMGADVRDLSPWKGKRVDELYRDGICGGAIIGAHKGELPVEVTVPLAHQSALAGIMVAMELLLASSPELHRFRNHYMESRMDMTAAAPSMVHPPRQKTRGCICGDADFQARYEEKWGQQRK
jgi:hypothetical protein